MGVTPDYTHAQKVAAANHFAAKGYGLGLYGHGYLYGKRSADSDAYYGYGGLGYAYYGYYGYPAYTAGYVHYGKRSADADAYYAYHGYPAYTAGYAYYG